MPQIAAGAIGGGHAAGFNAHLVKPVDFAALQQFLDRARLQRTGPSNT